MNTRYPIREIVKVIAINKPHQCIHFQIRHPENAIAITGITITSNFIPLTSPEIKTISSSAGHLQLAIPSTGDVVYSEDIQAHHNFLDSLEEVVYQNLVFKDFARSGKRLTYFDTFYMIDHALLEGYYEDTLYEKFSTSDLEKTPKPLYKVCVYLRYQLNND